jgi:hypothetical protein
MEYIQTLVLRVCMLGKLSSDSDGWANINVLTSDGAGGASTDYGGVGLDPQTYCRQSIDNLSSVNTGVDIRFVGDSGDEILMWVQVYLNDLRVPGSPGGPVFLAPPARNILWLSVKLVSGLTWVRDVMVWEWTAHPDTPIVEGLPRSDYTQVTGLNDDDENLIPAGNPNYDIWAGG